MPASATPVSEAAMADGWHREMEHSLGPALLMCLVAAGLLETGFLQFTDTVPGSPASGSALLWHFLLPFLAAVLWQRSLTQGGRAGILAGWWGVWSVATVALVAAPGVFGVASQWTWSVLALQQVGFGIGLIVGRGWRGSGGRAVVTGPGRLDTAVRALVMVLTLAVLLLPVESSGRFRELYAHWQPVSVIRYVPHVLDQTYALLKPLVLWVVVGILYGVAGRGRQVLGWSSAAFAGLLMTMPLLASMLRVSDLLEIVGAYWGIRAGTGLAARLHAADACLIDEEEGAHPRSLAHSPLTGSLGAGSHAVTAAYGARRALAALLLLAVVYQAWTFPHWGGWLAAGLGFYSLILARYPHAWLVAVPAALPALDLAPWTGRFYFDEFDLVMLTTLAMAIWHGRQRCEPVRFSRPFVFSAVFFFFLYGLSLAIGSFPLSPLDANAFASYWSSFNGLRVAKGFVWCALIAGLLRWCAPGTLAAIVERLLPGMLLGFAGVVAVGLRERWQFADLFDLSVPYRITATFSAMHTGGSEIETFLVMAVPFVLLALWHGRTLALRVAGFALLLPGVYLTALTVARGGAAALGVAMVVLAAGVWRHRSKGGGSKAFVVVALAASTGVLGVGVTGDYFARRMAHISEDWQVRSAHWQAVLDLRDRDWQTALLGQGVGRFPEAYLFRFPHRVQPGGYAFRQEGDNAWLTLAGGETLYMAQRVPVVAQQRYRLTLRARTADPGARLGVPICEKHLLDSHDCVWSVVKIAATGDWQTVSVAVSSGSLGAGNLLARRPVELALFNDSAGTRIDVDDIQLADASGTPLVRNGDFSAGADYWFFKTHSHLPWHIKNLWVHLLFEQGWLGVLGFVLVIATCMGGVVRGFWNGDPNRSVLLASIGGFLLVGVFGTLIDSPRTTVLFGLIALLAAVVDAPAGSGETVRRAQPPQSGD